MSETIIIPKKRIQQLLNKFDGVDMCHPIHLPITPYIENPSEFLKRLNEHNVLVEHYKKSFFGSKDTKIYMIFYQGSTIYRVNQKKKNWFTTSESWKDFNFFEQAKNHFNKII